ncbi:hypothetical protein [Methanobrevibacter sp. DSM 116169]|uniref:hypothetical protein n=1 Tax=Methanobrevibacter sp. DSM 116169 TaxID=3242727 RepID=UPI0038FC72F4
MRYIKNSTRILETIIGIVGGLLSLIGCSFIVFIGSFASETTITLGILGLIGALLGIFASFYVNVDNYIAGFLFIIAAIMVIVGATFLGIPGMLLLLLAGLLSFIRN